MGSKSDFVTIGQPPTGRLNETSSSATILTGASFHPQAAVEFRAANRDAALVAAVGGLRKRGVS